jgi:hypothetical protein
MTADFYYSSYKISTNDNDKIIETDLSVKKINSYCSGIWYSILNFSFPSVSKVVQYFS